MENGESLAPPRYHRDIAMRSAAAAQTAVQASVSAADGFLPSPGFVPAASAPAQRAAAAPAAAPASAAADQDPHLILKALQASMHPSPPPAAGRPAQKPAQKPARRETAAASTRDADGFDWMRMSSAEDSDAYAADPAMRALARESESLDDVYDPSEDPENLGPGPSAKDKAKPSAYWTHDGDGDAWWVHGGEDGMT